MDLNTILLISNIAANFVLFGLFLAVKKFVMAGIKCKFFGHGFVAGFQKSGVFDFWTEKSPSEVTFHKGEKNESVVTIDGVHHQLKGYWNPVHVVVEGKSKNLNLLREKNQELGGVEMAIALKSMKDHAWQKAKNRFKGDDEKAGFNKWTILIVVTVIAVLGSVLWYYFM